MTNLDSILKSKDITLPTKVHIVQAMFFQQSLTGMRPEPLKKAEHQRIGAFELWCWSPVDCKEIKSVIPKGNQH